MRTRSCLILSFVLLPLFAFSQWVDFTDGSTTWLPAGLVDTLEKDIAIGDLDKNGFTDVVIVRKNPFSNPGAGQDLLLLNTGSSLVDGTATYAPGFLSNPSDSRDVFIGDFDGDDWLDVVIANTFEDQPIYYRNLGDSSGVWLGLSDESDLRFPLPLDLFPLQFCAVWAGDITGNGALDLYFANYGANLGQGGVDDVLLVNDGNGFFTDETDARMGILRKSAFGTSCEIHDMDGDGDNDIIKLSTLYNVPPWFSQGVFILFNDGTGHFSNWDQVPTNAPYMFTVGDLNGDDKNDLYVVDDFLDYYRFAQTIIPDTSVVFSGYTSSNIRTLQLGGNCKFGDLDNDGDLDLGLTPVDVDLPPCETVLLRQFTLDRNNGDNTFTGVYGNMDFPWTVSAFDFAFLDLEGDGDLDIFLGKCSEYAVFFNQSNPGLPISISGNPSVCAGETTQLDAGTGFASYDWSNGESEQTIAVSSSGEYCVTITNTNGYTGTDCITVSVNDLPMVNISGDQGICQGGQTTLDAGAGFSSYIWENGDAGQLHIVSTADDYCVTATDANGCSNTDCSSLTEIPVPQFTLPDTSICVGINTLLTAPVSFQSFVWTTNETAQSIQVSGGGTYCVTATDMNGCTSTACSQVSEFQHIELELSPPQGVCEGETIQIEATSSRPVQLQWSNGGNQPTIDVGPGTWCATALDTDGCTEEACTEVFQFLSPVTTFSTTLCSGDFIIFNGLTLFAPNVFEFLFTGSSANGCDSTVVINLLVHPAMSVDSLTSVPGAAAGPDGSATAWISGGTPPYQYQWSNGDTSMMMTATSSGTYSVTVTDNKGCEIVESVFVDWLIATEDRLSENYSFTVFPNPFQNTFNLNFTPSRFGKKDLELFDARGQLVYQQSFEGTYLKVGFPLPSGLYFLKITNSNGEVLGWERLIRQ